MTRPKYKRPKIKLIWNLTAQFTASFSKARIPHLAKFPVGWVSPRIPGFCRTDPRWNHRTLAVAGYKYAEIGFMTGRRDQTAYSQVHSGLASHVSLDPGPRVCQGVMVRLQAPNPAITLATVCTQ